MTLRLVRRTVHVYMTEADKRVSAKGECRHDGWYY